MKLAEEWVLSLDVVGRVDGAIRAIRRIQADALRYAADLSGDERGEFLHRKADELDRNLDPGNG